MAKKKHAKNDQYVLGGIVRGVGKVFKAAAPIALPALGNLVLPGLGGQLGGVAASMLAAQGNSPQAPGAPGMTGAMPTTAAMLYNNQRQPRATGYQGGGYRTGGAIKPLGQDAVSFHGSKHESGGIVIAPNIEVEGGETMDALQTGEQYVFSDALMVPGTKRTFADKHKEMVRRGANKVEVDRLARIQEGAAGRGPAQSYRLGGLVKSGMQGVMKGAGAAGRFIQSDQGQNLVEYIPGALALGTSLLSKPQQAPQVAPALTNRSALNTLREMRTSVDVGSQLREAQGATRRLTQQPGMTNAALLAGQAQEMQNTGRLLGEARNTETELMNQQTAAIASTENQLNQRDAAAITDANRSNSYYQFQQQNLDNQRRENVLNSVRELGTVRASQRERDAIRAAEGRQYQMDMARIPLTIANLPESLRVSAMEAIQVALQQAQSGEDPDTIIQRVIDSYRANAPQATAVPMAPRYSAPPNQVDPSVGGLTRPQQVGFPLLDQILPFRRR